MDGGDFALAILCFFCNYRDVIYVAESVCTPFYVFRYIRGLSLIPCLTLHAHSIHLVRQESGEGRPLAGNHLELGTATLRAARFVLFFLALTRFSTPCFIFNCTFVLPFVSHIKFCFIKEWIVVKILFVKKFRVYGTPFNLFLPGIIIRVNFKFVIVFFC